MRFVSIGNANVDITVFVERIPDQDEAVPALAATVTSGGSASNFALAASKLGAKVTMIASVGDDTLGELYLRRMRDGGVDVDHVKVVDGRRTGIVVVLNVLGESRRMIESLGANAELGPKDIMEKEEVLKVADEVHMASVGVPVARAVTELTKEVSWDPGTRVLARNHYEVWNLLDRVKRIFLNSKEAKILSGEDDLVEAAKRIGREGPDEVIIKKGSGGAIAWADGELIDVKAIEVKVVDTTGAGDVFAATYLVSRHRGYDVLRSIRLANSAAALKISRPGTTLSLPSWDEIAAMEFISYWS